MSLESNDNITMLGNTFVPILIDTLSLQVV